MFAFRAVARQRRYWLPNATVPRRPTAPASTPPPTATVDGETVGSVPWSISGTTDTTAALALSNSAGRTRTAAVATTRPIRTPTAHATPYSRATNTSNPVRRSVPR
jgi:hypothetical protein